MVQDIEDIDAAISQFLDFARLADGEATVPGRRSQRHRARVCASATRAPARPFRRGSTPLPPLPCGRSPSSGSSPTWWTTRCATAAARSKSRPASEGGKAVLEVLDRGPGIPPAEAERMLQPFTRLDRRALRRRHGTGTRDRGPHRAAARRQRAAAGARRRRHARAGGAAAQDLKLAADGRRYTPIRPRSNQPRRITRVSDPLNPPPGITRCG